MKPKDILTKEFLEEEYILKRKSSTSIARELGIVSKTSVKQALRRHQIPIDSDPQRNKRGKPLDRTKGYGEISGSYWCSKRYHAKMRNLEFSVTIQEAWELFLLQGRRCALSNVELCFPKMWKVPERYSQTASLDRINSSLGYTERNVQWIHKDLNTMKMDLPQDKFIDWCRKVVEYQGD